MWHSTGPCTNFMKTHPEPQEHRGPRQHPASSLGHRRVGSPCGAYSHGALGSCRQQEALTGAQLCSDSEHLSDNRRAGLSVRGEAAGKVHDRNWPLLPHREREGAPGAPGMVREPLARTWCPWHGPGVPVGTLERWVQVTGRQARAMQTRCPLAVLRARAALKRAVPGWGRPSPEDDRVLSMPGLRAPISTAWGRAGLRGSHAGSGPTWESQWAAPAGEPQPT